MPDVRQRVAPLRLVALRLGLPELETVAKAPDVIEAFRVTIQYPDERALDQVATVRKVRTQARDSAAGGNVRLQVGYRRNNDKPLVYDFAVESARFDTYSAAMRKMGFDKLDDPPDIPWLGAVLWLVERAAGSFHHDVIIAPDSAAGLYAEVVALARTHFPQAVRALSQT